MKKKRKERTGKWKARDGCAMVFWVSTSNIKKLHKIAFNRSPAQQADQVPVPIGSTILHVSLKIATAMRPTKHYGNENFHIFSRLLGTALQSKHSRVFLHILHISRRLLEC